MVRGSARPGAKEEKLRCVPGAPDPAPRIERLPQAPPRTTPNPLIPLNRAQQLAMAAHACPPKPVKISPPTPRRYSYC